MTHPNKSLVNYVLQGLKFGFDIGYRGVLGGTRPKNLLSALKNSVGVQRAIIVELDRGHTSGAFTSPL